MNDSETPILAALNGIIEKKLRVVDLSNSSLVKEVPCRDANRLLAINSDGSRAVLTEDVSILRELSVLRLDSQASMEAKWKPYDNDSFRWAEFVAADELLTCSSKGVLRLWSLPNATLKYEVDVHYADAIARLTPDRRYLYDVSQRSVRFFEVATGKYAAAVELDIGQEGMQLQYSCLARDGKNLVLIQSLRGSGTRFVSLWDLPTGDKIFETAVPNAVRSPRWLGPDFLLLGDFLLSIRHQEVVWKFERFNPPVIDSDGRCLLQATYNNESSLLPTIALDDELIAKINEYAAQSNPLVKAGDAVTLDVTVIPKAPQPDFADRVTGICRKKLTNVGYRVSPGQPFAIRLTISEQDTGEKIEFQELADATTSGLRIGTTKTVAVPVIELVCRVEIVDQQGNSHIITNFGSSPAKIYGDIEIRPGQKVKDVVMRERWGKVLRGVETLLTFSPEYREFSMPSSQVTVPLDQKWRDAQLELVSNKNRAKRDREITKIMLPDEASAPMLNVAAFAVPDLDQLRLRRPMPLAAGRVREVKFSFPSVAQVAMRIEVGDLGKQTSVLHRYDLKSQKLIARTPMDKMDKNAQLLDFRPDGKLLLVSNDSRLNRLRVLQCVESDHTTVADLDFSDKHPIFVQAKFVGNNRLLTCDGREVFLWELPSGKPVFQRAFGAEACELSWGRRYFIDLQEGRPGIYNSSDGRLAGHLEQLGKPPEKIRCAAFRPDGKSVAAIVGEKHDSSGTVAVWDLETGRLMHSFSMQKPGNNIQWCSPRHLLTNNKLCDLRFEVPVWQYPTLLPASPDGRGWFVDGIKQGALGVLPVPSDKVGGVIDRVFESYPALLRSRESVRLNFDVVKTDQNKDELIQRITDVLTKKLAENDITVDEKANVVLGIWFGITGKRNATPFGFERDEKIFTMANSTLSAMINFRAADSKTTSWSKTVSVFLPDIAYKVDWSAANPGADLQRQLEEALISRIADTYIPPVIPRTSRMTIGQSSFDLSDERILPNSSFRSFFQ